jgi:hypothetical protein
MSGLVGVHTLSSLYRGSTYTLLFLSVFIQMIFEAVVSHTLPIPVLRATALSAVGLKTLFLLIFYGKVRE